MLKGHKGISRGGGTDPRKVRVGLDRAGKFKLYLYKCAKNGGLFYIFFMKKGVYSILFSSKIVETEVKFDNFGQNLGKNWYFWSKSLAKN